MKKTTILSSVAIFLTGILIGTLITTFYIKPSSSKIEPSGTNDSETLQNTIHTLPQGGWILLKAGTYVLNQTVTINTSNIHIVGEGKQTCIVSSLLPCLEIVGGDLDSGESLVDVSVENIHFSYTGDDESGNFIYVHGVQSDYTYQGAIIFRSISINSTQRPIPTNEKFVGLYMTEFVGVTFEDCNVAGFGTCLEFNGGLIESDMLLLRNTNVCRAKRGIYFSGERGTVNRVTMINQKVMFCSEYGIYGDYEVPLNIMLISPQFESLHTATCIRFSGYQLTVQNGMFSVFVVGIDFGVDDDVASQKHLVAMNNYFQDGDIAIYTRSPTVVIGNCYKRTVNEKIVISGEYGKVEGLMDEAI